MKISRRHWLAVIVLVLAVYVVLPQLGVFKNSLGVIDKAEGGWLLMALLATLLTFTVAAGTYCWLAFMRLPFGRTAIIQSASTFANRLLPAGLGNLSVNYQYLRRQKHSASQATAVVALNNGLGFIGHMLLLLILAISYGDRLPPLRWSLGHHLWLIMIILLGLILIPGIIPGWRSRLQLAVRHTLRQLNTYQKRPLHLLAGLATSVSLTLLNVLSFWLCLRSVNIHLDLLTVLLIFTFGVAIGTVTPTPGGLGGAEAALLAGLVTFRVPQSEALAAVILYRLVYYWFGLLLGSLAWLYVQRRGYLA